MQINLSGQHLEVTSALKSYANTKLQRLERYFDYVTNAHVVLSVEKPRQKAKATMHVSGGNLHADAVEGAMYAAIGTFAEKLDRQIKRCKEEMSDHHEKEGGLKAR